MGDAELKERESPARKVEVDQGLHSNGAIHHLNANLQRCQVGHIASEKCLLQMIRRVFQRLVLPSVVDPATAKLKPSTQGIPEAAENASRRPPGFPFFGHAMPKAKQGLVWNTQPFSN